MLSEMKPDPAFVEKLKQTMEGIEAFVVAFKEKQREIYESLLLEGQNASQEIAAFERKLDSWASIPLAQHLRPDGTTSSGARSGGIGGMERSLPATIPPAVVAFERFLQQTGSRQGGWDDYDHQTFLKTRSMHNTGNAAFFDAVTRELPTKTREEILQHEQWYVEFCALLESKQAAIEAWREEKQKKKHAEVTNTLPTAVKKSTKQELFEKEREARFSKLEVWKAEQRLRQAEAQEHKLQMEVENAKKGEREKKEKEVLKKRVEEYASGREAEFEVHRLREEARRAQEQAERRLANKELEKFRERDMQVITERRKKAEIKETEKREREKQLELLKEQVAVKVDRDPSRLYKLTKGWEERKKARHDSAGGGAHMDLPRRAVPSWRQRI